jgi:hypothetical protein
MLPTDDETLTIAPSGESLRGDVASCVSRRGARVLTARWRSMWSSVNSPSGPTAMVAALLTRTSRRPSACTVSSTSCFGSAGWARSPGRTSASSGHLDGARRLL